MKKINIIIWIFLTIISMSCCSKKNIITFDENVDPSKYGNFEFLINSTKYNSETNILELSGKLINQKNKEAVVGANLLLSPRKENVEGTSTDLKGEFNLNFDLSEYDSIEISYVFYNKKIINIQNIYNEYIKKN
ncbi:MAG: carboxypeptidase-like regulatory domain-containing protein [Ignavibacteriae bacterium]|nr:carboxypeptidase-like regulatory domain-containing protein [Ignavibacteriota bacterium]